MRRYERREDGVHVASDLIGHPDSGGSLCVSNSGHVDCLCSLPASRGTRNGELSLPGFSCRYARDIDCRRDRDNSNGTCVEALIIAGLCVPSS